MALTDTEAAFLEDLASAKASWLRAALQAIRSPTPDLAWTRDDAAWLKLREALSAAGCTEQFGVVIDELLAGLVHSFLVTLDGGSALAETTELTVLDAKKRAFRKFLHEYWREHDVGAT